MVVVCQCDGHTNAMSPVQSKHWLSMRQNIHLEVWHLITIKVSSTSSPPHLCTPVDAASKWRDAWHSTSVANKYLISDPTVRLPGFNLSRSEPKLSRRHHAKYNMLGKKEKSSDVRRTASLSEMGHEQRTATSFTVTDQRRKTFIASWPFKHSITSGCVLVAAVVALVFDADWKPYNLHSLNSAIK